MPKRSKSPGKKKAKPAPKRTAPAPKKPRARASVGVHHGTASETEVAARRDRVAAEYLSGKSQYAIAAAEKVNQATVSRDLAALRELWQASAVRHFGERQAEELAKIDRLEAEAWDAWERSKLPARITTMEKTSADDDNRTKNSTRIEGRDGNPAFLATVERCIAKRCEILGLDAPKKLNVGFGLQYPDLSHLPTRELDRILTVLGPIVAPGLPLPGGAPGAGAGTDPAPVE